MPRCARAFLLCALAGQASADEWVSLFDGRSLAGWKAAENPPSFRVVDGAIACDGPRAHLYYVGADGGASFGNFEAEVEVMTRPGANSGLFFHTDWQASGWPATGFEVQVDNSQKGTAEYEELKMTGSLYGIRNVYKALAKDDEWFTLRLRVRKPRVEVWVNGTQVVDWVEPKGLPEGAVNMLGRGTFALQCHDPRSQVFYRSIRVRALPEEPAVDVPVADARLAEILALGKANFPLVDLHAHLKAGLTMDELLTLSRRTGMSFGVAVNCGKGFAVQDDAAALAFVDGMKAKPVFVGMQAEGREWVSMFSRQTRSRFDYVFTDSMTWTSDAGRRMRLWIPEEVEVGDEQAFMEMLVARAVGILENEPIDIYVNPTFLPEVIAPRYDELWTEARMDRVIDAAAKGGVAIEINTRYRLPSEAFLRRAKAKGLKFAIGTNNTGPNDLGDWSYAFEMIRKLGLTWKDMFVPGHQPSRAERE